MPTLLKQSAQHPSGTAAFIVMGPAARQFDTLDGVQLSIIQTGQVDRYLDPRLPNDPWSTAVYRFYPRNPVRDEKTVSMEIDEGVTFHLGANQPYKLVIWRQDAKEIIEIFTHPGGMRQVSKPPADWKEPPEPGQVHAAAPVAAAVTVERIEDNAAQDAEQAARDQAQRDARESAAHQQRKDEEDKERARLAAASGTKKAGKGLWIGVALALLAVGLGGAWYWQQRETPSVTQATPATTVAAPVASASACQDIKDADTARACLRGDPDPAAARAAAEAMTKAGGPLEPQLMLYKYAGDKGDPVAARVMGAYNDPDTWSEQTSPMQAPNGGAAARWHKIAAEAGDAESQYRLGMLLKKGRTDDADGPEQAVGWLKKAADQGHEAAKKELSP